MVFGANTYRAFVRMLSSSTEESEVRDPWVTRMVNLPATVVSTTLEDPLDWPDATLVSGDAVDVVGQLKEESEVPLRSHGSLSMNRALMAAGLVDLVQVTLFPVITGRDRAGPDLQGCGRLRPGAGREPNARRSHPRAHVPAQRSTDPGSALLPGAYSDSPAASRASSRSEYMSMRVCMPSRNVQTCAKDISTGIPAAFERPCWRTRTTTLSPAS